MRRRGSGKRANPPRGDCLAASLRSLVDFTIGLVSRVLLT